MHRNRRLRGRVERTIWLLLSLFVAGSVWGVIWIFGRWLPNWEFALVGGIVTVAHGRISERARNMQRASGRTRVWVLPVRDQPADSDSGSTGLGPDREIGPGRDER